LLLSNHDANHGRNDFIISADRLLSKFGTTIAKAFLRLACAHLHPTLDGQCAVTVRDGP
jgi:hypothetical protein